LHWRKAHGWRLKTHSNRFRPCNPRCIALLRYQTGRWQRERTEALCPPQHAGRLDALLWAILKVRDAVPSERLIRMELSRASFGVTGGV
jgi:hypothetical protein